MFWNGQQRYVFNAAGDGLSYVLSIIHEMIDILDFARFTAYGPPHNPRMPRETVQRFHL